MALFLEDMQLLGKWTSYIDMSYKVHLPFYNKRENTSQFVASDKLRHESFQIICLKFYLFDNNYLWNNMRAFRGQL